MSAYITISDLTAYIPADMLSQGLDDSGDGSADQGLFDSILSAVQAEIDGALGGVYAAPFTAPIPPFIRHAALVLSAHAVWQRRGATREVNPYAESAAEVRRRLQALSQRVEKLDIAAPPGQSPGALVTEPSLTHDPHGRLSI